MKNPQTPVSLSHFPGYPKDKMTITVFYIDDEEMICENFQDEFESDEVIIKTFIDPTVAIDEAKNDPPDLIFVDFRFPNSSGDKLANALPEAIPKILVTGDLNINATYEFTEVLTKPAPTEDVQRIIEKQLLAKKSA